MRTSPANPLRESDGAAALISAKVQERVHAVVRLVTAVCVETHDEWAVAERRYLSEESMAKIGEP